MSRWVRLRPPETDDHGALGAAVERLVRRDMDGERNDDVRLGG